MLDRMHKEYNAYRAEKRGYPPGGLLADILWLLDALDEKNRYIEMMTIEFTKQLLGLKGANK